MKKEVEHILDYFNTDEFVLERVGTEYRGESLVVFYEDYYLPIEDVFHLINGGKRISLRNFKK